MRLELLCGYGLWRLSSQDEERSSVWGIFHRCGDVITRHSFVFIGFVQILTVLASLRVFSGHELHFCLSAMRYV